MIKKLIKVIELQYNENKASVLMPIPFLFLLMYFFITEPKLSFVFLFIISGIVSMVLFVKWILDVQDDYHYRDK